jgi:hypothetical protein
MTTGMSFTQKLITVNLTLKSGTFDGTNNTKVISGLRVKCEADKSGTPSKSTCKLKIYGMLQNDMDTLTTIPAQANKPLAVHHNLVQVLAGDVYGMSTVFQGDITEAFSDFHAEPETFFSLEAITGYYPSIAPVAPKSYKGGVSVSTIMQGLALQMGYTFQDAGVTAQLRNPYLSGTAMQQAQAVANAANIEFGVDNGTLFIAPRGASRPGFAPLISPGSGLIEYPTFSKKGIKFSCLYTPGLSLGGLVNVQSSIKVCCGTWKINSLKHELESMAPNGKWLSKVSASWIGS